MGNRAGAMKGTRTHLVVLAVFAALTVAMTWPMAARMADSVRNPGDPLFNAWVLSWDVHQLAAGNLRGFFDANIFYPNHRTLAYSEHLLPEALRRLRSCSPLTTPCSPTTW